MAKILYVRCSTTNQSELRQIQEADNYDKVYVDKCSGKSIERPALTEMLDFIRSGDEIECWELSRLGRSTFDLLSLTKKILAKNVSIRFIKENLYFRPDTQDPVATLTFEIFCAFANFERSVINQRCAEGRAIAKANGVYKGSKKHLNTAQIEELRELAKNKEAWNPTTLAKRYNICRSSVYNYLKA